MDSRPTISRVYVYVDGFNFYVATKGTRAYPFGWCNWHLTAENYCGPSRRVSKVKYFTSRIIDDDETKRERQALHLKAMGTIAEIVPGRFVKREEICSNCGHTKQFAREKMTDTNIAIHMVLDAAANRYDEAFLVSADMDLLPAVQMVTDPKHFRTPRKVTLLIPPYAHTSREFRAGLDEFPNRVRVIELNLTNLVRFSLDLAATLGHDFPKHWAEGSTGPPVRSSGLPVDPNRRRRGPG
jgi:hypothetical protein